MALASKSLGGRVLLPILALAVAMVAAVLLVASEAVRKVHDDYDRFTLGAGAAHVAALLDLAASELTAAALAGNPVVLDAKQREVRDAVSRYWSSAGLDGIVLGPAGEVLASTLVPRDTEAVLAARRGERFQADGRGGPLHGLARAFPAWGWTVVTVARPLPLSAVRPELAWLLPLLALAAATFAAGVLGLLWRNVRRPLARMAADVDADREVRPSGIEELDVIGAAVNSAVARLRVRSSELAEELERRRTTERVLADRETHLRLLLESTAEGILGVDARGVCTFCNPAALRLLGHPSEQDLLGKGLHQLVHAARPDGEGYPEEECPVLRTCASGKGARIFDEVFWRRDGSAFRVEYWSYPLLEGGRVVGAVIGFVDVSERAALEEQLRQSQKMEAIGRLAGGIAHDFNNMLMAIQGHATVAREQLRDDSPLREDLDQVLAATEKATGLTRHILAFSRKQPMQLARVDLNDVVLGMGKVIARLLGEDVEVAYRLAAGELPVLADRAQLEQVLLNLWTNARDAMPRGGRLTIRTAIVDASADAVVGPEGPGRYVLLTVADTGDGMDERTRRKVFEPFFTTKARGKGTGLGLSIVYGIVKQHRGHIDVASAPGQGATFRIFLPLTEVAAAAEDPARPAPTPGGTETVLVAEDNDEVRALVRSVLAAAGYRVLAARDGEEAAALHEAHADEIALCLFDVVMPRLGGREALARIRTRGARTAALLMSGYVPDDSAGPAAIPGVDLITKPIVPRELLRRVREALDGGRARPRAAVVS